MSEERKLYVLVECIQMAALTRNTGLIEKTTWDSWGEDDRAAAFGSDYGPPVVLGEVVIAVSPDAPDTFLDDVPDLLLEV